MTTPDDASGLTQLAAQGIHTVPWRRVLTGATEVSAVSILTVAGLSPLAAGLASGSLSFPVVMTWLASFGGKALAAWIGAWATHASADALRDPAVLAARAKEVEEKAGSDGVIQAALAGLLTYIQAVPEALASLQKDGAQSDLLLAQQELLTGLQGDLQWLGKQSAELRAFVEQALGEIRTASMIVRAEGAGTTAIHAETNAQGRGDNSTVLQVGEGAQIGDITIGNAAGRDVVVTNITQVMRSSPLPYRTAVLRMTEDYAPIFGGRDSELATLDAWLERDLRSFALLHAPTGRGKTALLLHWAAQVHERGTWHVVFVPISLRYQTHTAASALGALATALAAFYGEPGRLSGADTSPDQLQPIIADFLRRKVPAGRQLLVVLDGLDEATGWEVNRSLFPLHLGSHLRIVASARERARVSVDDWLAQLGWEAAQTRNLSLEGLSRAAVSDVLRHMGNPLDDRAEEQSLLDEIARVSQGDPLTIRYLIEALRDGIFTGGDLRSLTPGLEAIVRPWLHELERQSANGEDIYALLSLCAVALGPLSADDVMRLAPESFRRKAVLMQAVKQVGRFIIGDGSPESGFVFGHPRLRELYLERVLSAEECNAARQRFVAVGEQWFVERTAVLSPYLRQFWVAHMAQAGAWQLAQAVVTQIEAGPHGPKQLWAELRYASEGSYNAYLSDLAILWRHANRSGDLEVSIVCATIAATINSLSENILPALLVQLVTLGTAEGKWDIAPVLEVVRQMLESTQKAEALVQLRSLIPGHALELVLEIATSIADESQRTRVLIAFAPYLSGALAEDALAIARDLRDEKNRTQALLALTPQLRDDQLATLLAAAREIGDAEHHDRVLLAVLPRLSETAPGSALALARELRDERKRTRTLLAMVPSLRADLLSAALAMARDIRNDEERTKALAALVPLLGQDERGIVLDEALVAARGTPDGRSRAQALVALLPLRAVGERTAILDEALAAAVRDLREDWRRSEALRSLVLQLAGDELGKALTAHIREEGGLVRVLRFLAPLPVANRVADAFAAARDLRDEWSRETFLSNLAPLLDGAMASEALDAARDIREGWHRDRLLLALVPRLEEDRADEALAIAKMLHPKGEQAEVLLALARRFGGKMVDEALAAARALAPGERRAKILIDLVPFLSGEVLGEVLAALAEVKNEWLRVHAILALAPLIGDDLVGDMFAAACEIVFEENRAKVLVAIAPRLHGDQIDAALAAAHRIYGEKHRVCILEVLAPHLSGELVGEALAVARMLRFAQFRVRALVALAPRIAAADERAAVLGDILTMARSDDREVNNADILIAIVPLLTGTLVVEALAVARAIRSNKDSVRAMLALLPLLEPEARASIVSKSVVAARAIPNERDRAQALITLAPHLRGDDVSRALAVARTIADEGSRPLVLAALAPLISGDPVGEALAAARSIQDQLGHALLLAAFAAFAAESVVEARGSLLREALAVIGDISDGKQRSRALMALPSVLAAEEDRAALVGDALVIARDLPDARQRLEALSILIALLPDGMERRAALRTALADAQIISYEQSRVEWLIALAPLLSADLMDEAIAAARELRRADYRAQALVALAPLVGEHTEQTALLEEALTSARDLGDNASRIRLLVALAPLLSGDLVGDALELARAIRDHKGRIQAVLAIAPQFAATERAGVLGNELEIARAIADERTRAQVLEMLAPQLDGELVAQALALVRAISNAWNRTQALVALAPRLSGTLVDEALTLLQSMFITVSHVNAFVALVPQLTSELLDEALAAARSISNDLSRALALTALAPRLAAESQAVVVGEILGVARAISDEQSSVRLLRALTPMLKEGREAAALEVANAMTDAACRAEALTMLAPLFAFHERIEVLRSALAAIRDGRFPLLVALAPMLGEPLADEALAVARTFAVAASRARALAALAPVVAAGARTEVLSDALAAARSITDEQRVQTLATLTPLLIDYTIPVAVIQQTLVANRIRRSELLLDLAVLAPWIGRVLPAQQVGRLAQAIHAVCQAWP